MSLRGREVRGRSDVCSGTATITEQGNIKLILPFEYPMMDEIHFFVFHAPKSAGAYEFGGQEVLV